ncbi:MAG: undecaprenyl-diphosphate phosphatase [Alphaproteobacteria bacterium]|jgi:undecaprenyl-diphosphatase|nr:undecaprenyl-diphosphate phosphatase [Alphaproteobacteria bacterium]MBP7729283.1 undecaprenyl-diphosphate phosphatase [Alphaproteobacteria bacterium]
MTLEQILLLSFIQGITEFLPISSSGHLVLIPTLCGWKDQGIMMDVAAHIGTLGSVLIYFYKDVISLFNGFFSVLKGQFNDHTQLLFNLIIATIPVVLLGLFFEKVVGASFRSVTVIAWCGILFGIILYIADKYGRLIETVQDTTLKRAFIFGLAQCLALVNGVSRSGACITIGRFMNYKRTDAARFAFLMSIPTITAAGILKGYHLMKTGDLSLLNDAALTMAFSFVFGFCAIAFMMHWLRRSTLTPFVIYRVILGIFLLGGVYSGFLSNVPCQ